jgi:hypothetical protein
MEREPLMLLVGQQMAVQVVLLLAMAVAERVVPQAVQVVALVMAVVAPQAVQVTAVAVHMARVALAVHMA